MRFVARTQTDGVSHVFSRVLAPFESNKELVRGSHFQDEGGLLDPRALAPRDSPAVSIFVGFTTVNFPPSKWHNATVTHLRKGCTLYLHLFVASYFCVSVSVHAPRPKMGPNQLKRNMYMRLVLFVIFPRAQNKTKTRQNAGDSTHERPHPPSLRGDGCPGYDIHDIIGRWRHGTAIACPDIYRYLLFLHHRSDGTIMYTTTLSASGIMCAVHYNVRYFDWRPTKTGK